MHVGRGSAEPSAGEGAVPLTVLYLGAQLALFGVLEDGVVAGVGALHRTVAAGLVEEGAVPTGGRAAGRGQLVRLARAGISRPEPKDCPSRWKQGTFSEARHG